MCMCDALADGTFFMSAGINTHIGSWPPNSGQQKLATQSDIATHAACAGAPCWQCWVDDSLDGDCSYVCLCPMDEVMPLIEVSDDKLNFILNGEYDQCVTHEFWGQSPAKSPYDIERITDSLKICFLGGAKKNMAIFFVHS